MANQTANSAYKKWQENENNNPGQFRYDDTEIKRMYDNIQNRKPFSFDLEGNAMFKQYKDNYQQQGRMAMADTVGQVAAMSGGYGNSYAQTAGQQIYQQNLQKLNDIIPALHDMAFSQYQAEGQNMLNLYNMALGDRDFAYNQYRGEVADWQANRAFSYDNYINQRNYEYQQGRDSIADQQWQQQFEYQQGRDNVSDQQWQQQFEYQQNRDARADQQWQQQFEYQQGRDNVSDQQWQQNYNLDQARVNETIRSNKASEDLAKTNQKITIGNTEMKESDFNTLDTKIRNAKVETAYDSIVESAIKWNAPPKSVAIEKVFEDVYNEKITPGQGKALLNSLGYFD